MSIQIKMDIGGIEELRAKMHYLDSSMRDRVYHALNSIANDIVIRAKALAPVKTGRLMHSIYAHVSRDWVLKVGATAPYARYQEFGTRFIQPRAFLTQALLENLPRLSLVIAEALRLAIQEASKR